MPITNPPRSTRTIRAIDRRERYQQLLGLRVELGCRIVDALVHSQHAGLSRLLEQCNHLDETLERYTRYRRDYTGVVLLAEDCRYHEAGQTMPRDSRTRPCIWCRPDVSVASANFATPALRNVA